MKRSFPPQTYTAVFTVTLLPHKPRTSASVAVYTYTPLLLSAQALHWQRRRSFLTRGHMHFSGVRWMHRSRYKKAQHPHNCSYADKQTQWTSLDEWGQRSEWWWGVCGWGNTQTPSCVRRQVNTTDARCRDSRPASVLTNTYVLTTLFGSTGRKEYDCIHRWCSNTPVHWPTTALILLKCGGGGGGGVIRCINVPMY